MVHTDSMQDTKYKLNWKFIFDLCSSLTDSDCFVTLPLRRVVTEKKK